MIEKDGGVCVCKLERGRDSSTQMGSRELATETDVQISKRDRDGVSMLWGTCRVSAQHPFFTCYRVAEICPGALSVFSGLAPALKSCPHPSSAAPPLPGSLSEFNPLLAFCLHLVQTLCSQTAGGPSGQGHPGQGHTGAGPVGPLRPACPSQSLLSPHPCRGQRCVFALE